MDTIQDILQVPEGDTTFEDTARFIPHRVFMNHVDQFNGKAISSVSTHCPTGQVKFSVNHVFR